MLRIEENINRGLRIAISYIDEALDKVTYELEDEELSEFLRRKLTCAKNIVDDLLLEKNNMEVN